MIGIYKDAKVAYVDMLRRTKTKDEDVVCAYLYGSRVYGNFRNDSDYDYIVILHPNKRKEQFSDNLINVTFYSLGEHSVRLTNNEPSAMECYFLPKEFVLKEDWMSIINVVHFKLRESFSAKASNSWVKAKKKLTVTESYNDYVGKKSLWHALRLLDFGTQIARDGRINDYGSCNGFYDEVMYCNDWNEMFEKYKKLYNKKSSEFKKFAPKS